MSASTLKLLISIEVPLSSQAIELCSLFGESVQRMQLETGLPQNSRLLFKEESEACLLSMDLNMTSEDSMRTLYALHSLLRTMRSSRSDGSSELESSQETSSAGVPRSQNT